LHDKRSGNVRAVLAALDHTDFQYATAKANRPSSNPNKK
jgi:hypothetical protein